MDTADLKKFLIEVIEQEFGPKPVEIAPRWHDGMLILRPGNDSQEKEVPLDVFFKKLLSVRDSLRVLEQKLNSHDGLSTEDKATFHSYITKAYGSLTTFNILFKEDRYKFHGTTGKSRSDEPKMTMAEAKKKLGLNEY